MQAWEYAQARGEHPSLARLHLSPQTPHERAKVKLATWMEYMSAYQGGYSAPVRSEPRPVEDYACGGVRLREIAQLQRRVQWRGSLIRSRRRSAYEACVRLISFREAALGIG